MKQTALKHKAANATRNFVAATDKKSTVAPSRRGFKPSSSSQLEAKSQFSGMHGYKSGSTGSPKHCSISSEFGTAPKTMSAAQPTTTVMGVKSYSNTPAASGGNGKSPSVKHTSNPGSKY